MMTPDGRMNWHYGVVKLHTSPPGQESWYEKLTYLLHHGTCLENLNPRERRALGLKSTQYRLINSYSSGLIMMGYF
jgi:hypothetical protein